MALQKLELVIDLEQYVMEIRQQYWYVSVSVLLRLIAYSAANCLQQPMASEVEASVAYMEPRLQEVLENSEPAIW